MHFRILMVVLFAGFFSAPALAALSPAAVLERAEEAYRMQNREVYRMYVTQRSLPWVEKAEQYPLHKALPPLVNVIGTQKNGDVAVLRVESPSPGGKPQRGDVVMHKEGGVWKLDFPDTMEKAMGKDWEAGLMMVEQTLASMRRQMPPEQFEALQNQIIEGLARTKRPNL